MTKFRLCSNYLKIELDDNERVVYVQRAGCWVMSDIMFHECVAISQVDLPTELSAM